LHLRYAFADHLIWRASVGRGQRTANIFAENNGLMASSRTFHILNDDSQNWNLKSPGMREPTLFIPSNTDSIQVL
jgi:outer membrane receptor for ferrienterochelin and colicins